MNQEKGKEQCVLETNCQVSLSWLPSLSWLLLPSLFWLLLLSLPFPFHFLWFFPGFCFLAFSLLLSLVLSGISLPRLSCLVSGSFKSFLTVGQCLDFGYIFDFGQLSYDGAYPLSQPGHYTQQTNFTQMIKRQKMLVFPLCQCTPL